MSKASTPPSLLQTRRQNRIRRRVLGFKFAIDLHAIFTWRRPVQGQPMIQCSLVRYRTYRPSETKTPISVLLPPCINEACLNDHILQLELGSIRKSSGVRMFNQQNGELEFAVGYFNSPSVDVELEFAVSGCLGWIRHQKASLHIGNAICPDW